MSVLAERIERALAGTRAVTDLARASLAARRGDLPAGLRDRPAGELVPAAVLVPLVQRSGDLTVLLTQRAEHLKHHAGQISFPGGRLEPGDATPLATALRESGEEIGLEARFVRPIGYLDTYLTITGYAVTPVVAFVTPGFSIEPDGIEVTEVFEVPLAHLFAPDAMRVQRRRFRATDVSYYEAYYDGRRIWGATAAMLMNLRDKIENG